jgi:hypothetical protein
VEANADFVRNAVQAPIPGTVNDEIGFFGFVVHGLGVVDPPSLRFGATSA